jgi:hypothetical protein
MPRNNEADGRFDRLLHAMVTRLEPSEKPAKDNRTSNKASGADYRDTRIREVKSSSASSHHPYCCLIS